MKRWLLGLALFLAACTGESAPEWKWATPAAFDEPALLEFLKPRGAEKLVLANFWATW